MRYIAGWMQCCRINALLPVYLGELTGFIFVHEVEGPLKQSVVLLLCTYWVKSSILCNMVLILDSNSEHVACAWKKDKIRFVTSLDLTKCLKQIK